MAVKQILVVDDSMSSRLVLRKMLQQYNVAVAMVESAKEALDYLAEHKPDAIFMDHYMPGVSGVQALKMLKDNPATAALPVVMFTGKQDADYAETIHRQGAVGILPKPFTEEALFSIMQTLDAVASGQAALAAGETAAGARAAPQHLDRAVQEHIERLVGEKFAALQIPNDEHIEEIAERMLLPVIEEAMQEVRERIERDFGARLQQLLNVYEEKFSGRLGELQQSLSRELDELRLATGQQHRAVIEIEPVAEVGATSGYFMMDSIVAENTHSTWSDASEQPLTENDAPQLLQVGRGAMPAGEKRRYTLVGLAAAVILAVFGLIYLYRSLLT